MNPTCNALIISCIDFRLQEFIHEWADREIGIGKFDLTELAGSIFDPFSALRQLEVSSRLHHIQKVIAVNHEDCGAYGAAGTRERHRSDLLAFKEKVVHLYPELQVELYYLHLDGTFERI